MLREGKLAVEGAMSLLAILSAGTLPACTGQAARSPADPNRLASPATAERRTARPPPAEVFLADGNAYRWISRYSQADALANRISPPQDHVRVAAPPGSFAHWLRGLPLKPGRPDVLLHNGRKKANQEAHHAVVDMDVSKFQECADAVMRLRAEYLLSVGGGGRIKFRTGTGFWLEWPRWEAGDRPVLTGRGDWRRSASPDSSYRNFRAYLDKVFEFVGTASLAPQLTPVARIKDMHIGDVFIRPGSPGHAVIVVDTAEREGDKVFLLAQSYMPAQDLHILRNPSDAELSPWYGTDFEDELRTPEWKFEGNCLKRFPP